MRDNPFESIESAHEYVALLRAQVDDVRQTVAEDIGSDATVLPARSLDALRLVQYKLAQLEQHLGASSRVLNDLRSLRRLLLSGVDQTTGATTISSLSEPAKPAEHV